MAEPERQPLGSVAEVAAYLGVTAQSLYRWRSRGEGPRSVQVGGIVRYRWADVEQWLDEVPTKGGQRS